MSDLGIHPAQLAWLDRVGRGEKIIWHTYMHLLSCFALDFSANEDQYVSFPVTPDHFHDLLYPLYGRSDRIAGIQFWCMGGILQETDALTTLDASGSLSPLHLYEHGVAWYERRSEYEKYSGEQKERMRERNALAIEFLRAYPLTIPSKTWELALPRRD